MEQKDFTKYIIPRKNKNQFARDEKLQNVSLSTLDTTDKICVLSETELSAEAKKIGWKTMGCKAITDFALMNFAWKGKYNYGMYFTRTPTNYGCVLSVLPQKDQLQLFNDYHCADSSIGISPAMSLKLDKTMNASQLKEAFDVSEKVGEFGKYHIVKLGLFPRSKVDEDLKHQLEYAYNDGHLIDGMKYTGKFYTTNGANLNDDFLSKQNAEFEYQGEKYVRTIVVDDYEDRFYGYRNYSDGSQMYGNHTYEWVKVEPVNFRILNYEEFERNGADTMKLDCDEIVLSGISFFPTQNHNNPPFSNSWSGSLLRAYLNSANSDMLDGNKKCSQQRKWDFSDSGFLQQAFNLQRPAITKYAIPRLEEGVCDYAFEGCVGLEKILIPRQVKYIGKYAFSGCVNTQLVFGENIFELKMDKNALEGIEFKYIYISNDGKNMIWSPYEDKKLEKSCTRYDFDKNNIQQLINKIYRATFFYDEEYHNQNEALLSNDGLYEDLI